MTCADKVGSIIERSVIERINRTCKSNVIVRLCSIMSGNRTKSNPNFLVNTITELNPSILFDCVRLS